MLWSCIVLVLLCESFIFHGVPGIPISHQHLLYNFQELDDSACLIDYAIQDGATLKLVLSMRGGPISTRHLPPEQELAWKELRDFVESNR